MHRNTDLSGRLTEATHDGHRTAPGHDPDADAAVCAREAYAGKLFPGRQLELFRNSHWVFSTRTVARGESVYQLPYDDAELTDFRIASKGGDYDLVDYVSRNRVAGLLILKQGRILLEKYEFANNETTRWVSMSMAKSISTTLVGAALHDGFIRSVDDPLTHYLPKLSGSGY